MGWIIRFHIVTAAAIEGSGRLIFSPRPPSFSLIFISGPGGREGRGLSRSAVGQTARGGGTAQDLPPLFPSQRGHMPLCHALSFPPKSCLASCAGTFFSSAAIWRKCKFEPPYSAAVHLSPDRQGGKRRFFGPFLEESMSIALEGTEYFSLVGIIISHPRSNRALK